MHGRIIDATPVVDLDLLQVEAGLPAIVIVDDEEERQSLSWI